MFLKTKENKESKKVRMCYSFKTSIFSYILGMTASLFALSTGQYILGTLIIAYCQIQLSEAIIWRGIDTDNLSLNKKGTKYAKYTLPSHLLFVGIGIALSTYKETKKPNLIPFFIGLAFYIAVLFYYTSASSVKDYVREDEKDLSFPSNRACMKRECQNNENRLQWPFDDTYYILQTIIIYILFFIYLPRKSMVLLTTFFTSTYIISNVMYTWSTSSIWCFLSAILAPILVFINYHITRK